MSEFTPDSRMPRSPRPIELVEAEIDYLILPVTQTIEENLAALAESSDPEYIRSIVLAIARAAFGAGVAAQYSEPRLVERLTNIADGQESAADL